MNLLSNATEEEKDQNHLVLTKIIKSRSIIHAIKNGDAISIANKIQLELTFFRTCTLEIKKKTENQNLHRLFYAHTCLYMKRGLHDLRKTDVLMVLQILVMIGGLCKSGVGLWVLQLYVEEKEKRRGR